MKKHLPLVKRRTLKDPISVTNYFRGTKAKIEISAFLEDWEELWKYWYSVRGSDDALTKLGAAFLTSFMSPASKAIGPNWKVWKNGFIQDMQMLAGFYHAFFQHCFKNLPDNSLPICIMQIEGEREFQTRADTRDPAAYTAYCLQVQFDEVLKAYGLKPFFDIGEAEHSQDLGSFYITYIQEGRHLIRNTPPDIIIGFWCNILASLIGYTSIALQNDNGQHTDNKKRSLYSHHFIVDMLRAFLLHENDYIRQDIREEVSQIHDILIKLYPFLKDTGQILEDIKKDDIQTWYFFEDHMTYHDRSAD